MESTKTQSEEQFQLVTGRRKTKRKNIKAPIELNIEENLESNRKTILRKIKEIFKDDNFLEFMDEVLPLLVKVQNEMNLKKMSKLVCLGLGSFLNCISATHQMAFALKIQKFFNIDCVEFFDPIMTRNEVKILQEFDWQLLPENHAGKYPILEPTLLYFPHCHRQLTNNFLWKNWSKELLEKAILICNSFNTLISNTPERLLNEDSDYILKIANHTKEIEIENKYQLKCVFNDTSIHIFLDRNLPNMSDSFWEKDSVPVCTEIITESNDKKL